MKTSRNLLLLTLLLIGVSANAQFAPIGPDIYNVNMPGNVGIGTLTPSGLLDVHNPVAQCDFLVTRPYAVPAANSTIGTMRIMNTTSGDLLNISLRYNNGVHEMIQSAYSSANSQWLAYVYLNMTTRKYEMRNGIADAEFKNSGNVSFNNTGLVGIGTNAPFDLHGFGTKIDVRGDIQMSDNNAFIQIDNTLTGSNCGIVLSEVGAFTSWIWYDGSANYLTINADPGGGYRKDIIVHSTGEVGIGTSTTKTGYRLSVDGKVACEEVLVENSTNWPDYVFGEDYKLLSLEQLEESIEENNHLPGMPSAAEIEENGFSLGEMQKIFLEKLEELTLYTIEQGKQIKEQQERIEALEQENKKLRK